MKANEIREMGDDEILETIENMEEEFLNLRFQAKMGQLSNPLRLRVVRRDIARLKTLFCERTRGAQVVKG